MTRQSRSVHEKLEGELQSGIHLPTTRLSLAFFATTLRIHESVGWLHDVLFLNFAKNLFTQWQNAIIHDISNSSLFLWLEKNQKIERKVLIAVFSKSIRGNHMEKSRCHVTKKVFVCFRVNTLQKMIEGQLVVLVCAADYLLIICVQLGWGWVRPKLDWHSFNVKVNHIVTHCEEKQKFKIYLVKSFSLR